MQLIEITKMWAQKDPVGKEADIKKFMNSFLPFSHFLPRHFRHTFGANNGFGSVLRRSVVRPPATTTRCHCIFYCLYLLCMVQLQYACYALCTITIMAITFALPPPHCHSPIADTIRSHSVVVAVVVAHS